MKFNFLFRCSIRTALCQNSDTSGPVFIEEPPNQVDFSNTTGTEVVCQSRGTPMPAITWVRAADGKVVRDVPGLRQVGRSIRDIHTLYTYPTRRPAVLLGDFLKEAKKIRLSLPPPPPVPTFRKKLPS